ncbi:hypothetical protein Tco_0010139 [Tanacetum coccineum]
MAEYSQKWHNETSRSRSAETSDRLVAIQAQLNNLGREIKKVNEKVYAAQVGCEQCKGRPYTKDFPLKEEGKTLEEAYYTNNANPSYQEQRQSMENSLSKFMRTSIKTLEIQIGQMSKVLKERGFGSLPSSTEANLRDQVKSISTTIEADSYPIRHIGSSQYAISTGQNSSQSIPRKEKDLGSFTLPCLINNVCFDNALVDLGASVGVMSLSTYLNLGLGELAHTKLTVKLADRTVKYPKGIVENILVEIGKFTFLVDFIILDMPEDIKVLLILERPFLSTTHAKIDVYKRKIILRAGKERIMFTSVKPASSLIKRIYMLSLRERMELDLEARLMGETLVLNRSLDHFFKDYVELNDLNEPFELRRNQGDDLIPTIEEGEVIGEFRTRDDELDAGIDDYPGALMNVPIFVGTFSVVTDFVVLENMDDYHDEGMGDVIFVTYQMVRSHPRFKYHTNEKCNKIPPLLKVSEEDKMNEISHPYQKLKGFYIGVLNLGPDYILDAKMEEWLTRGHINVHDMER